MKKILQQLMSGGSLTAGEAEEVFGEVMEGRAEVVEVAGLLTLLAVREPTVEELVGAATVMRRHAVGIDAPMDVIDVCGTGGTGSAFFNVSTAAAVVAAACGVPVVKHGNRSVTSRSGSSDVLRELGVNVEATVLQEEECLRRAGICFAFCAKHHPAMRHVAGVREGLGFATIFNLLGPLTNPAGARRQLVGVGTTGLMEKILRVLVRLGAVRAMVVCGRDRGERMCEISITGETEVMMFDGGEEARHGIRPGDLGLREFSDSGELVIGSAGESAKKIRGIFAGEPGAAREIVLANAGAAVWVGGKAETVLAGVEMARAAVDGGEAGRVLAGLAEGSWVG